MAVRTRTGMHAIACVVPSDTGIRCQAGKADTLGRSASTDGLGSGNPSPRNEIGVLTAQTPGSSDEQEVRRTVAVCPCAQPLEERETP